MPAAKMNSVLASIPIWRAWPFCLPSFGLLRERRPLRQSPHLTIAREGQRNRNPRLLVRATVQATVAERKRFPRPLWEIEALDSELKGWFLSRGGNRSEHFRCNFAVGEIRGT